MCICATVSACIQVCTHIYTCPPLCEHADQVYTRLGMSLYECTRVCKSVHRKCTFVYTYPRIYACVSGYVRFQMG